MSMNSTVMGTAATTQAPVGCPAQRPTELAKGIKAAAYILVILFSLFGNAVVVRVVQKNHRMRTITNYLIINMAFADVLTTIFNMLPTLYWVLRGIDVWAIGSWIGETLCKVLTFAQSVSISVSVFTLCAIAFDRFFAIFRPLKRVITFRVAKGIIVASWLLSLIVSGPQLYVLTTVGEKGFAQCVENWGPPFDETTASRDYTVALFVFLYALPLAIIASLYTVIMLKLWRRKAPGQELTSNQEQKDKTNRKVLKMLVTVVIVFALSWLPLYARMFVIFAQSDRYVCGLPYEMDFFTLFLGHANSAVNPYIYVIFNENYRRGFRTVLSRRGHGSSRGLSQSTTRRTKSTRFLEKDTADIVAEQRDKERRRKFNLRLNQQKHGDSFVPMMTMEGEM